MTLDLGSAAGLAVARETERSRAAPDQRLRLPHEPALDGLRGLAVAAVVSFHLGRLEGGFLGVDLFFVLSGFLITSLLITDPRQSGRIDLARFWARRARRLLPALALVMVGVAVVLVQFTPDSQRAGFRGDALATLGYVANWHRMVDNLGYWDMFSQPSPLDHMWSLAIEEQFYVVWPLVALVVLGAGSVRRLHLLTGVAFVGAAVSLLLLAATYSRMDTTRAYFSTDTRIGPTLLGAALAALTIRRPRRSGTPTVGLELVGLAALAWMTWSVFAVDGINSGYYRGGLASFAVAALVVVRAVTGGPPGRLARTMSWSPLRWLGSISYGVYLWHWPIIVYATAERVRVEGVVLEFVRVALTLVAATASYYLVEQPIRRGALRGWQIRMAAVSTATVCLTAVLVATSGHSAGSNVVTGMGRPRGPLEGVDRTDLHVPADVAAGTPRLLVLGDSGTQFLGPAVVSEGDRSGVAVAFSSQPHCSVLVSEQDGLIMPHESLWERPSCAGSRRLELWTELVDDFDPDVVVYYLASAGGLVKERVDGEWVWDCDEAYDDFVEDGLLDELELLGRDGATVAIATSPYTGFLDSTVHARVDCRNATYRRVAAESPAARIVDLNAFVEHERDTTGEAMLFDQMHLSEEGARRAARWLLSSELTEFRTP